MSNDVTSLLAPFLRPLPRDARPRFLALLEHEAAERYRSWAAESPEHATILLECAEREDSVAERVAAVWPIDATVLAQMQEMLPEARVVYAGLFVGRDLARQWSVQAAAEMQGHAAWSALADGHSDPDVIAELHACAALEAENATALRSLVTHLSGA